MRLPVARACCQKKLFPKKKLAKSHHRNVGQDHGTIRAKTIAPSGTVTLPSFGNPRQQPNVNLTLTKVNTTMASRRPFLLPIAGFLAIGAICIWEIGAQPQFSGFSQEINNAVWLRKKHLDANGTPLQTRYTGIFPVDVVLSMLVAVFAPGAAGWDERVRILQLYLLTQVFAICCVWTVEAHQVVHRGRVIGL